MDLPTPPPSTDTPGHQVVDQPLRLLEPMDIELPPIPSTSAFTLLTTPPIPWPQPTPASTSLHLQTGGRHWPIASSSSSTAREEYLEALYLPDQIYPFTDLVHSLKGRIDESFLLPVPAISQKHRKVLPPLLSTLLSENPPHSIGSEESVAEDEWRAFKSGFGVRLGSRGLGVAGKGKEGESEEERNERRSAEEEVWVREGKEWVEELERRECVAPLPHTPSAERLTFECLVVQNLASGPVPFHPTSSSSSNLHRCASKETFSEVDQVHHFLRIGRPRPLSDGLDRSPVDLASPFNPRRGRSIAQHSQRQRASFDRLGPAFLP